MAKNAISSSPFAQLISLSQLSLVRQLGFMLILAASIALGIATVMWSQTAGYTPLYTSMTSQDSSDVVAALEQRGVPYKIDNGTGLVTVPADRIREIRMQLANEGLPRTSSRGFDILEEDQSLGTSNFIEQARYQRALEQELVQTIKQIQGVRDARVHLSIPRQTSFIRNSRRPSASVMIDVAAMTQPGDTQLSGILHLVASSVAGMETEDVSIVDQRGNLLSDQNNSQLGNTSETMRYTRTIEQEYSNRIIDILTPIVGAGNVRAQVSANLDFTATETTEERYNPDNAVVRSEQVQEERLGGAGNGNTGVAPGTLADAPPQEGNANQQQAQQQGNGNSRMSSTRNFEIDRSINHIRRAPGTIQQLSVAVLVDLQQGQLNGEEELDQDEIDSRIERLTQLVRDSIGYSAARGDSVSVLNEPFLAPEAIPASQIAIWEQPWFFTTIKQAGASIVVIFLIFGVLRPAMKSVVGTVPALSHAGGNLAVAAAGGGAAPAMEIADDTVSVSEPAQAQLEAAPAPPAPSVYDQNLSRAQSLVSQEPQRAARMIQNWIAND